jgi:hypothetical protein
MFMGRATDTGLFPSTMGGVAIGTAINNLAGAADCGCP